MRIVNSLIILLALAAALQAQTANSTSSEYQPQVSIRDYFLGAWKLVSTEVKYPDGHTGPYPEMGPGAAGFLIYTPSGHMCAQLMKPGRPAWLDDRLPTVAEASSALDGFVSYCGRFEIREGEKTVIHHPETAWAPNWVGTEQQRPYHFVSQDRFFFRVPSREKQKDGTEIPVTRTITWERLK
jgi:hypothetical protein